MAEKGTSSEDTNSVDSAGPFSGLIRDGKNARPVRCERCSSLVLKPGSATFTQREIFLPHMKKKNAQESSDGETLHDFWLVNHMMTFENVGFSNTVHNIKYLTCADCEIGPIGCHNITDKSAFFVAVERVNNS